MGGGLGTIITIIIVVAWVVKGLASVKGDQDSGDKPRKHRSLEEWDEVQSQRRAEMSDQQEALSQMRADASAPAPSQMTMAERIELARQRARQQAGGQAQGDGQADALRRARAQAEQKAQRERQVAQQRAEREQAVRQQRAQRERAERVKQQRRQHAQEQAEAQAKQQHRTKPQRRQRSQSPTRASTGSSREHVVAESMERIHKGHAHAAPAVTKRAGKRKNFGVATPIGSLDRKALKQAFIMKELLDKPVALRDPQADLLL